MTDLGRTEVRRADCSLCHLAQAVEEDDMAHALGTTHNGEVL